MEQAIIKKITVKFRKGGDADEKPTAASPLEVQE